MFEGAIDKVGRFTRPIHTIVRFHRGRGIQAGAATLFFVNDEGWALTCRHVATNLLAETRLNANYEKYKQALEHESNKPGGGTARKIIEKQFGFKKGGALQIKNALIGCPPGPIDIRVHSNPSLDVALLRVQNHRTTPCEQYPTFAADGAKLQPGMMVCRLGFPFAEFSNYRYNEDTDDIEFTNDGKRLSPRFPLDAMVTRHIAPKGKVTAFEVSRPGIKGQSGGPVFDASGVIWGMQFQTMHLDLEFDINVKVLRNGQETNIDDHAFLNVGHCVHVDVLKEFMDEHGVRYATTERSVSEAA